MAYLLQHLLTEAAARQPGRPAVASGDGTLSYQELDRLSTKVARALLRLGVTPGDREAPAERLGYVAADCGAAVIVADPARASQAAALAAGVPGSPGVLVTSGPEVAAESCEPLPGERAIENDLAYILY